MDIAGSLLPIKTAVIPNMWHIGAFVFYILLIFIYYLIYRYTSKEFHKFTKNRLIAVLILFAISTVWWAVFKLKTDFSDILSILNINFLYGLFYIVTALIGVFVAFYSTHLLVCSTVNIYKHLFQKRFKRNKRDVLIAILYLIFLNGIARMIYFVLFVALLSALFVQSCPQEPCGVQIIQVQPNSPAEMAGITPGEVIIKVDYGETITSSQELTTILANKKPNQSFIIHTDKRTYDLTLGEQTGKAWLGIATMQKMCPKTKCFFAFEQIVYTPEGKPILIESGIKKIK